MQHRPHGSKGGTNLPCGRWLLEPALLMLAGRAVRVRHRRRAGMARAFVAADGLTAVAASQSGAGQNAHENQDGCEGFHGPPPASLKRLLKLGRPTRSSENRFGELTPLIIYIDIRRTGRFVNRDRRGPASTTEIYKCPKCHRLFSQAIATRTCQKASTAASCARLASRDWRRPWIRTSFCLVRPPRV